MDKAKCGFCNKEFDGINPHISMEESAKAFDTKVEEMELVCDLCYRIAVEHINKSGTEEQKQQFKDYEERISK